MKTPLESKDEEIRNLNLKNNELVQIVNRLGGEKVKNNIMLHGIPLHKKIGKKEGNILNTKFETVHPTRLIVDKVLRELQIDGNINGCYEAVRFKQMEEKILSIHLKFCTFEGRCLFFYNLGKNKATSMKKALSSSRR